MDIYDKTQEALQKVRKLQMMKNNQVKTIRNTNYKFLGRIQVPMSFEDQDRQIKEVNKDFEKACNSIYESINKERLQAGLPVLENPYK